MLPENSELGKKTHYDPTYNPEKLFPIPRHLKRSEIGITPHTLPFYGYDLWNHFEVSWLNEKGKPIVAVAEIIFPADSFSLIESKSMKLYFNSFNNTQFKDMQAVVHTIKMDLEALVKSQVIVKITPLAVISARIVTSSLKGHCIDDLDISCFVYKVDPTLLMVEHNVVDETLYSDLLRSNCLVTGQPDWGSLQIAYQGQKINHESLLQYIVSFRNHNEFGEHCVERIFMDIMQYCKPNRLMVAGHYTRRGGIDINCYRASYQLTFISSSNRLHRQ